MTADRRPRRAARAALRVASLAVALAGCGDGRVDPRGLTPPSASASATPVKPPPPSRLLLSFLDDLPQCDVEHRGLVLDAGTRALATRYGFSGVVPPGVTDVEHDGSTWARVADKKIDLLVPVLRSERLFVSARVQGRAAKTAQVLLDDQPLGTLTFGRDEIKTPITGATTLPVDAGLHLVSLRFFGRAKDEGAFADVDWIRVGTPDDIVETYGAPTMRDVVSPQAALGGVPHKSLALRAPGTVRCRLRLAKSATLRAWIGLQGEGAGEAEIRVVADGKPNQVAETIHVESGTGKWIALERPLAEYGTGIVGLELVATKTSKGSRILFGDPEVILPAPPPQPAALARAVVVVVLDGVERQELPPWSTTATPLLVNLQELAIAGAAFDHHRGPTTVVPAAFATLITGVPPRAHGLVDGGARLPAAQTTIAGIARDASVRTAMFTGVPTTFKAFGFGEGWEKYAEFLPSSGDPASAPFDAAAAWVTEVAHASGEPRMLVVVHARGGHPPWDVREIANVPPKDYTGLVEPRRAAQILAKFRRRRAREVLSDADRTRIRALEQIALGGQDRALGGLIGALKTANVWDQTLFVVTGDVASGASDAWLYGDGLDLKEPLLALPLYAHFPGGAFAGRRVGDATSSYDVTKTVLDALGLAPSQRARGRDLAVVASEVESGAGGIDVATLGDKYAARWGDVVLIGRLPKPPDLCDLSVDSSCAFNRRDVMPITTLAIFQRLVLGDAVGRGPVEKREPATIDPETLSQLSVWGQD